MRFRILWLLLHCILDISGHSNAFKDVIRNDQSTQQAKHRISKRQGTQLSSPLPVSIVHITSHSASIKVDLKDTIKYELTAIFRKSTSENVWTKANHTLVARNQKLQAKLNDLDENTQYKVKVGIFKINGYPIPLEPEPIWVGEFRTNKCDMDDATSITNITVKEGLVQIFRNKTNENLCKLTQCKFTARQNSVVVNISQELTTKNLLCKFPTNPEKMMTYQIQLYYKDNQDSLNFIYTPPITELITYFNPPAIKRVEAYCVTFDIAPGLQLTQNESRFFKRGYLQIMREKTKEIEELDFGLNGGEVKAGGLYENTEYLYRAIVEDEEGVINETVEWKNVTTHKCQPIASKNTVIEVVNLQLEIKRTDDNACPAVYCVVQEGQSKNYSSENQETVQFIPGENQSFCNISAAERTMLFTLFVIDKRGEFIRIEYNSPRTSKIFYDRLVFKEQLKVGKISSHSVTFQVSQSLATFEDNEKKYFKRGVIEFKNNINQSWAEKAEFYLNSKVVEVFGLEEDTNYIYRAAVEETDGNRTSLDTCTPECNFKTLHCIENDNSSIQFLLETKSFVLSNENTCRPISISVYWKNGAVLNVDFKFAVDLSKLLASLIEQHNELTFLVKDKHTETMISYWKDISWWEVHANVTGSYILVIFMMSIILFTISLCCSVKYGKHERRHKCTSRRQSNAVQVVDVGNTWAEPVELMSYGQTSHHQPNNERGIPIAESML